MCAVCTEAVHSVTCHMYASTTERRKSTIFPHVANSSGSKNKELQDCVNMPFMFPTNVWREMYSHTTLEKRMLLTCTWLARIGLKNPSEASLGAITVVCNWREWSQQLPPRRTMAEDHMKMKQLAKKYLKASVCSCKGPLMLPRSFQNLPEAIRTVFSEQTLGKFKI